MKTNSLFKRLVSMLIVVLMICTLFPMTAFAATISIEPDKKPSDYNYSETKDGVATPHGTINKNVGETGSFLRLPYNTLACKTCGYIFGKFYPVAYCDINVTQSNEGVIGNISYEAGRLRDGQKSYDCLKMNFKALKPGETTVTLTYYCNFLIEFRSGLCPGSYYPVYHYVSAPDDFKYDWYSGKYYNNTWYKYTDTFTVFVSGDPSEPEKPNDDTVKGLLTNAVKIDCVNTGVSHNSETYPLSSGYTVSEPVLSNGQYICTVTIDSTDYITAYNTSTKATHSLVENEPASKTITLAYDGEKWAVSGDASVTFNVECDTPAPQVPVVICVYRNGDTTTPYSTKTLKVNQGSTFKVGDLDINDYYSSSNGFEFEGWYNDGGWNYYKAGNKDNKLPDEITVSGWTNIYCMVTDYENVVVKAVTDDDKVNAETIFTGKALHGSNLIDFLNSDVSVSEKTGYTLDKWFNWDWYGHKFDNTSVVNGWTNVYVTYTSKPYTVIAKLYIDGEPAYYQATDFYTTSITGKYGETINYKAIKDWAEAKAKELKAGSSATIFEATIYKDGGTFAPEETFGQFNPDIFTTYVWVDVTTKANTKPLDPVVYYYEVRHLQEQLDGSFKLVDTDRAFAQKGTEVTAVLKDYPNYTPAPAVSGTVIEVTVNNDGTPNYLILEQKYYLNTYSVTYTDGVGGKVFKDDVHTVKSGATTPAFVGGIPTRPGYVFVGWTPTVSKTVTGNATYTATWRKVKDTTVIEIGGGNSSSSSSKEENPNTGAPVFVGVSVGALAAAK